MTTHVLDANLAAFADHLDTFVDPDLVTINQEVLDGRTDATVLTAWDRRNALARALQEAIDAEAPHLRSLPNASDDADGDLFAAGDTAAFKLSAGLACAMRPSPTHPDGIGAFEAFQMVPIAAADLT